MKLTIWPLLRAATSTTLLLTANPSSFVTGCTTIAVGRRATTDGSVFSSHSNDGEGTTDPRLVLIPASGYPANATRKIYYSPESFPRYVGFDRASKPVSAYEPGRGENPPESYQPICEIPQVRRTYRYMEETYGALNERQLGISESTCSGVFGAAPKGIHYPGYGEGKACMSIDTLSQIAMERHHKARDAVLEMGQLAVQYGFYGAGLFEGTAESLIVADPQEAWIFHILPDPTGASAIWAARRVPDDSFAVVPNVFIIREIDVTDKDNYLWSTSVFSVARQLGWYSPSTGKMLDFTATYSDGEYSHKYYSGRRSWGVFHAFAPSLELDAEYEEWRISDPYPFAAKPDKKLGVEDVAKAMRSFYEHTPYSQGGNSSSGLNLAGGPWKSPDHVSGGNSTPGIDGNWERTIGLYRTSDSYITQSRSFLPDSAGGILWFGAYAAPYTMYTPFAAGMLTLPHATLGHHMKLDKRTLFWASRYVGNYVQLKWSEMMEEVNKFQGQLMEENLRLVSQVDELVVAALGREDESGSDSEAFEQAVATSMELYHANAEHTVSRTWELADHLMFKYADGQIHHTPASSPLGTSTPPRQYDTKGFTVQEAEVVDQPGYPDEWLKAVGYESGPPPPPDCRELEWRCGHKPDQPAGKGGKEDGATGGLRRDDAKGAAARQRNEEAEAGGGGGGEAHIEDAWRDYVRQKSETALAGTSSCASRGDVAAALGGGGRGKRCGGSRKEEKQRSNDKDGDNSDSVNVLSAKS